MLTPATGPDPAPSQAKCRITAIPHPHCQCEANFESQGDHDNPKPLNPKPLKSNPKPLNPKSEKAGVFEKCPSLSSSQKGSRSEPNQVWSGRYRYRSLVEGLYTLNSPPVASFKSGVEGTIRVVLPVQMQPHFSGRHLFGWVWTRFVEDFWWCFRLERQLV